MSGYKNVVSTFLCVGRPSLSLDRAGKSDFRVALLKRRARKGHPYAGRWAVISGSADLELETPLKAALREVGEEVALVRRQRQRQQHHYQQQEKEMQKHLAPKPKPNQVQWSLLAAKADPDDTLEATDRGRLLSTDKSGISGDTTVNDSVSRDSDMTAKVETAQKLSPLSLEAGSLELLVEGNSFTVHDAALRTSWRIHPFLMRIAVPIVTDSYHLGTSSLSTKISSDDQSGAEEVERKGQQSSHRDAVVLTPMSPTTTTKSSSSYASMQSTSTDTKGGGEEKSEGDSETEKAPWTLFLDEEEHEALTWVQPAYLDSYHTVDGLSETLAQLLAKYNSDNPSRITHLDQY